MKERLGDFDTYRGWENRQTRRPRLVKFRDEDSLKETKRRVRGRQGQHSRTLAKRTLFNMPNESTSALIRDSNFPPDLLSRQAIDLLESEFRWTLSGLGITETELTTWLNGNNFAKKYDVVRKIRGSIFEEVVTREFVKKNPNYFVVNPVLTSKIIAPIISKLPPSEFVMPDHLVFLKSPQVATLIGFIEDKKSIGIDADDELFEQLESEWSLYCLIAEDDHVQAQFRREVTKNIPSIPFRMQISPVSEATLWLATTREASRSLGPLPGWVIHFQSSISGSAINKLVENIITQRFLPNLSLKNGLSPLTNSAKTL